MGFEGVAEAAQLGDSADVDYGGRRALARAASRGGGADAAMPSAGALPRVRVTAKKVRGQCNRELRPVR